MTRTHAGMTRDTAAILMTKWDLWEVRVEEFVQLVQKPFIR